MALLFNVLVLLPLGGWLMVHVVRTALKRITDAQERRRIGKRLLGVGSAVFAGMFLLVARVELPQWAIVVSMAVHLASFVVLTTGLALLEATTFAPKRD